MSNQFEATVEGIRWRDRARSKPHWWHASIDYLTDTIVHPTPSVLLLHRRPCRRKVISVDMNRLRGRQMLPHRVYAGLDQLEYWMADLSTLSYDSVPVWGWRSSASSSGGRSGNSFGRGGASGFAQRRRNGRSASSAIRIGRARPGRPSSNCREVRYLQSKPRCCFSPCRRMPLSI